MSQDDDIVYRTELSAEELFQRASGAYKEFSRDNNESIRDLKAAAQKGHGQAQYALGVICYASLKFQEAAQWFEQSAEQKHPKQEASQEFLTSIRENFL